MFYNSYSTPISGHLLPSSLADFHKFSQIWDLIFNSNSISFVKINLKLQVQYFRSQVSWEKYTIVGICIVT